MPHYSKKDFADLCFTTTSDLSNYIRRKNVVVRADELIDSSDEVNAAFIVKRQQLQIKKTARAVVVPAVKPAESLNARDAKKSKEIAPTFDFPPEMKTAVHDNFVSEGQLKKLTLEKTQNEIELQNLKIQKQQGEVIPTQLVKNLIAQHSKSITISFRNGAENFLIDVTKKAGLSIDEVAALRGLLVGIINTAVNDSIEETKAGLKHIIDEYTKQRGVGERE